MPFKSDKRPVDVTNPANGTKNPANRIKTTTSTINQRTVDVGDIKLINWAVSSVILCSILAKIAGYQGHEEDFVGTLNRLPVIPIFVISGVADMLLLIDTFISIIIEVFKQKEELINLPMKYPYSNKTLQRLFDVCYIARQPQLRATVVLTLIIILGSVWMWIFI